MATEAHDYTKFDKKLLAYIEAGRNTAEALSITLDAERLEQQKLATK